MVIRDEKGEYVGLQCSEPGCEVMAPSTPEILAGHGLNNMGWRCSGGTHLCPAHAFTRHDGDGQ